MRVFLRTFGCRANQYDSETVRAMVERSGGEVVASPDDADVAIFNSCAVTTEAEVELRKGIRRAARQRPELRTLVMGCATARDTGGLRVLPTVQHVVAGADFEAIAAALQLSPDSLGAAVAQHGTRALLRIQDGCDEHCTFCATTQARGANRSRPADALVEEALQLAERHPEIVLTGIHIGSYGHDIGSSLGRLVARLVRDVPTVRFRLSSVEATEVDGQLAELFQAPRRLVPHLHAPLQSGSDRVLRRMGRHWYTARRYAESIEALAATLPVFGLGADVIAGFPGETDDDHAATVALLASLPFTYLHVFPFSMRPGTAAEKLDGPLAADVVQRRARELRALGDAKGRAYRARRVGAVADLVVVRNDIREGMTEDYLSVSIVDPPPPRGTRIPARLDGDASGLVAHPLVQVSAA
ncbi:MAG: MiaB/RimO family radical SAM methylthiotransferase [Gemmatimonadaceae bacterium]|nr:MiaB/RimO family radical SAM methylthiotransferase [Gemmatimonadaceae bacterium]